MERREFLAAALGLPKRPKTKTSTCEVWVGTSQWRVETETDGRLPAKGTVLVQPLLGECTSLSAEIVCGKKARYVQRMVRL